MSSNKSNEPDFPHKLFKKVIIEKPKNIWDPSLSEEDNQKINDNNIRKWMIDYVKTEKDIYRIHKKIIKMTDNNLWFSVIEEECGKGIIIESFAILVLKHYPDFYNVPIYYI